MEPINVTREKFPTSQAKGIGMKSLDVKIDNYELNYEYDVEYIKRESGSLYLQVITPINIKDKSPAIVYIPGSAFHKQDVKSKVAQLGLLARKGFAIFMLEYRPSEVAVFPAQILDAKAGVGFVKDNSEKYNVDSNKVFTMGDSSGGYTALMTALTSGVDSLEEKRNKVTDTSVKGVIDLYGPTNIATMNDEPSSQDHRTPDSPEGFLIGQKNVLDNLDIVKPTIVKNYVNDNREIPPVLIFHGTNDELVLFGQSCQLNDALINAGREVTFYAVTGAHHGDRQFWSEEVLNIISEFILKIVD